MSERSSPVWVVAPTPRGVRRVGDVFKGRAFRWCYLGDDPAALARLEAALRETGTAHPSNRRLQEWAGKIQKEYVKYVAGLGRGRDPVRWWAGALSEKNPDVSSTFLRVCRVLTAVSFVEEFPGDDWVFFIDNAALRRLAARTLPLARLSGEPGGGARLCAWAIARARWWGHRLRLVLFHAGSRLGATFGFGLSRGARRALKAGGPCIVLLTWAEGRSFSADGRFKDFYLGDLGNQLRAMGRPTLTAPRIMPSIPLHKAFRFLRKSETPLFDLHAFLSWGDLLGGGAALFRNFSRREARWPPFLNMDISEVIDDDLRSAEIYPRSAESLLYFRIVRSWKRAGLPIERIVFPYENHGWEKVLCGAVKTFFPGAVTVGYQHSRLPTVIPNYFEDEADAAPGPDWVIANGDLAHERLMSMGRKPSRVLKGGSLRFSQLLERPPAPQAREAATKTILVALAANRKESQELLLRVHAAWSSRPDVRVLLKGHPDTPFRSLVRGLPAFDWPGHFQVVENSLEELVRKSDVMVYTTSTSCFEALGRGVPVLHYVVGSAIDSDPLDFAPESRRDCDSAETLARGVDEILSRPPGGATPTVDVRRVFRPMDEAAYRLFLTGAPGARP